MMMKISLFALLPATVAAFGISASFQAGRSTQLFARPDATPLIEAALAASAQYGATSQEARVAWEAVEELDDSESIR